MSVTLASPPPSIVYDGTTDVTNWVKATVTGVAGAPAPSGTTTFTYYTGMTPTGTPLTSSPTGAGTYTVVANYSGDSNYAGTTSSPTTFTILPASATTVTIASPPASIVYDGRTDVTSWVKATVSRTSGKPAPTGRITFTYYAGSAATGTPLSSSPINAGTYTVVASYAGDANYPAAKSASDDVHDQPCRDNGPAGFTSRADCLRRQDRRDKLGEGHGDGHRWRAGADRQRHIRLLLEQFGQRHAAGV